VVNCSTINEKNAKWNGAIANGQPVNGTCLIGYQGTISRTCIQYGSIGNWSSITGSCNGISLYL